MLHTYPYIASKLLPFPLTKLHITFILYQEPVDCNEDSIIDYILVLENVTGNDSTMIGIDAMNNPIVLEEDALYRYYLKIISNTILRDITTPSEEICK